MFFCDVFFFEKEPHLNAVEVSSITHNTVPHINSETNPSPPPSINVACKYLRQFLTQASVLLLYQYATTLSRDEGADLFLQSGPFQNF